MSEKIKKEATAKRPRLLDWDDLTLIEFQDEEFVKAYINEIFTDPIRTRDEDPTKTTLWMVHAFEKITDAYKYKLWKQKRKIFQGLERRKKKVKK